MSSGINKYSVYQPTNRRQRARRDSEPSKPILGKLLVCLLVVLCVLGIGFYINHSAHAAARAAALAAQAARLQDQKNFAAGVKSLISANDKLQISVTAIDLKSGETQSVGAQTPFNAASTTKLLTAILYLREVEQGRRNLNTGITWYSGPEALRQLINRSNDAVWTELNDELGSEKLESFARSIGVMDYDFDANSTSSKSMATLLQKLYKGQLLSTKNTNTLLSYMQETNYENFIPPAVDKELKLYHKVGLVEDYVHDAAVISDGQNDFVLVIYTNGNGTYNWGQRAELMQEITKFALPAYL